MKRSTPDRQSKLALLLQTFYHVGQYGSFSKAAKKLNQSRSTLTNHIFELELLYSVRLINRTTRSFSLSYEGKRLFEQCIILNDALSSSHELLTSFNNNDAGHLNIKIPNVLDNKKFHSFLTQFKHDHPSIHLNVVVDNELGDLVSENMDIAFHIGELPESSYINNRICDFKTYVVAAPEFWKKNTRPKHPCELSEYACIQYRHCKTGKKWSFKNGSEILLVDIGAAHICDSDDMLLSFALDGLGITTLLDISCEHLINERKLETCLENWTHTVSLNALMQSRDFAPTRVRNFISSMKEKIPTLLEQ